MVDMIIMVVMANTYEDALNKIVIVLNEVDGSTDRNKIHYNIGQATMLAKLALGSRISKEAQQSDDDYRSRILSR